jgi:hypothetical protein
MELRILVELDGRIQPITAFTFLNFYNRYFKQFGVLKRRCIAEIIVRAQGGKHFNVFSNSYAWRIYNIN